MTVADSVMGGLWPCATDLGFVDRHAMSDRNVDIVIPARNNCSVITATLDAIEAQSLGCASCTVVDGLSTDGTVDFIRRNYPWVNVICKRDDSGPAASRNIGAFYGKSSYVVFVDSDVRLTANWLEQQVRFLESHPKTGVVYGKLVYASNPEILHTACGKMNRFGIGWDCGDGEQADSYKEPKSCLWASTAALMVRRQTFEATGGFDDVLFAGHEDCDFGWRSNLLGHEVSFNPHAVALHQPHATINEQTMSGTVTYLLYRNRLRSALVNYEFVNVLRYTVPYMLMAGIESVLRARRRPKLRAFGWNIVHLSETLRRRHQVQRHRKVRDNELWSLFEAGIRGPGRQLH
jgi:GT2 family glycosyltransferase